MPEAGFDTKRLRSVTCCDPATGGHHNTGCCHGLGKHREPAKAARDEAYKRLRCKEVLHMPMGEDKPCLEFRCILTTRDHIDHTYDGTTEANGKIVWYSVDWEIES